MLLTVIIVILFYIGVYLYIQAAFENPVKNQRAQKEFKLLLRQVYTAKTIKELKDYETWFLEFILAYDLTNDEKNWYNNMFFDLYAKRLTRVKKEF